MGPLHQWSRLMLGAPRYDVAGGRQTRELTPRRPDKRVGVFQLDRHVDTLPRRRHAAVGRLLAGVRR